MQLMERKRAAQEEIKQKGIRLKAVEKDVDLLIGESGYKRYERSARDVLGIRARPLQLNCSAWCSDKADEKFSWKSRCSFLACNGCTGCDALTPAEDQKATGARIGLQSDQIINTLPGSSLFHEAHSSHVIRSNHSSHSSHSNNSTHNTPSSHSGHSNHGNSENTARGSRGSAHVAAFDSRLQPSMCPWDGVTACCKGDGFGAQYLALMSVFAFSLATNTTFCITPWSHVQHGVDSMDDGNGALGMFSFVGGHLYGPQAVSSTRRFDSLYSHFEDYANRTDAIARIRSFYFATPKPHLHYYSSGKKSIAVHVRRGDVTPKDVQRWTSIEMVSACVASVIKVFAGAPTAVHIFSDGTREQLSGLDMYHPHLHLRDNIKTAFHHMVQADVLIMAKSSLSGTAAILRSQGWNFQAEAGSACAI